MNYSKRTLIACSAALMMLTFTVSANASVTLVSPKNRGGSVCLNSLEPFLKWFFRSVMPLPGLVAVFSGMPDRAFVRPVPNAASLCCKSADIAGCFRGRRIRFHMHAGKPPRI